MTSEEPEIIETRQGHIAVIEMNRPPHNYFDEDSLAALADRFAAADSDSEVRAIVLAARGKSFCAGAVLGRPPPPGPKSRSELIYDQALRIFAVQKPIVAAIEGAAIGGGLGLAMAADLRIAGACARFAANFTALGFHPGFGLSVTLPRAIGADAASLLMLTSRRIGADAALGLGLVTETVAEGEALSAATALAQEIASAAPLAVQSTRATLRQGLAEAVSQVLDHELAEQDRLRQTEDFKEGIAAARERRTPEFKGQ